MAELNFDATNVPQSDAFDPMPAAWYNAAIDQSEMKPTKDTTGSYLELRFTILDGQYVGRKVFTRLNLRNANPVAQEIAWKQMSTICHAVNMLQVGDSMQLHGQPMKIRLKVKPATADYEASNEISGFKNVNEQVGTAPAAAAGAIPPAAGAAPWKAPTPAASVPAATTAAPAPWKAPAAAQPWAKPAEPVMTEKAGGATYQAHIDLGWTDEALIAEGLMVAPVAAPAAPAKPAAAPAPAKPAAAAAAPATGAAPPWATKQ